MATVREQTAMTAQAATEDATADIRTRGRGLELRLWGVDAAHIQRARESMAAHPSRNYWRIIDTAVTQSPVTTITPSDPDAVAQGAHYGWAWAVYPAEPLQVAS